MDSKHKDIADDVPCDEAPVISAGSGGGGGANENPLGPVPVVAAGATAARFSEITSPLFGSMSFFGVSGGGPFKCGAIGLGDRYDVDRRCAFHRGAVGGAGGAVVGGAVTAVELTVSTSTPIGSGGGDGLGPSDLIGAAATERASGSGSASSFCSATATGAGGPGDGGFVIVAVGGGGSSSLCSWPPLAAKSLLSMGSGIDRPRGRRGHFGL